jgi:plastocyanin
MRARLRLFAPVVGLGFLVSALASCGSKAAPSPNPGSGSGTNSVTVNIPASDGYGATGFSPATVAVKAGGTVTWSNKDGSTHNTASDTGLWDSDIAAGAGFSRVFNTTGSFAYHCKLHGFTGTITVQ